jgi:hypothetical protein
MSSSGTRPAVNGTGPKLVLQTGVESTATTISRADELRPSGQLPVHEVGAGTENWLPIPGFEGAYSVSDQGRVRSEERVITYGHGDLAGQFLRRQAMKILRPTVVPLGYPTVSLYKTHRQQKCRVHELVLLAFAGQRSAGLECLHSDDVKTNNVLSNLSYGTRSDNICDMVRNGRHWRSRRSHCDHGHAFTAENTAHRRTQPRTRICRECRRSRRRQICQAAA